MSSKNRKHFAFTMAEMMIVLLILSIISAAFLPVITKRIKHSTGASSSSGGIWQWTSGSGSNIYVPKLSTSGAMIGTTSFPTVTTETARLLLYSDDASAGLRRIIFANNSTVIGRLVIDSPGGDGQPGNNIGLGNVFASGNSPAGNATALGSKAFYCINSGYGEAMGNNALYACISCNSTALGADALLSAYYEVNNTAVGASALKSMNDIGNYISYNTAIGYKAIEFATSGTNNLGIGAQSSYMNTADATESISLGYKASNTFSGAAIGSNAYAYSNSTAIGYGAGANASVSTAIGYNAKANSSYSIAIGNACTIASGNNYQIKLGASSSYPVYIPGNLIVNGTVTGKRLIWYISDKRLKNVNGLNYDGLDKINKLKIYNYTMKKDKNKTQNVGVVAQDLQKVFPNAVRKGDDGYLVIRQDDMFYAMVNAIKELDIKIQALINDIKTIASKIQDIDNKIIAFTQANKSNHTKIKSLENKALTFEKRSKTIEAKLNELE